MTQKKWQGIMAALMNEWGIGQEQAADAMAVFFREEAA